MRSTDHQTIDLPQNCIEKKVFLALLDDTKRIEELIIGIDWILDQNAEENGDDLPKDSYKFQKFSICLPFDYMIISIKESKALDAFKESRKSIRALAGYIQLYDDVKRLTPFLDRFSNKIIILEMRTQLDNKSIREWAGSVVSSVRQPGNLLIYTKKLNGVFCSTLVFKNNFEAESFRWLQQARIQNQRALIYSWGEVLNSKTCPFSSIFRNVNESLNSITSKNSCLLAKLFPLFKLGDLIQLQKTFFC